MGKRRHLPFAKQPHGLSAAALSAARQSRLVKPLQLSKKRVMLALPTEHAQLTTAIAMMLADAVGLSMTPGYPFEFEIAIVNDKYPTEYARNCLAKKLLDSKCEAMWFIDSDTLPTSNSFELLKVDADIACGIYPIGRGDRGNERLPFDWSFYLHEKDWSFRPLPLEAYEENEVVECDAAATGCMIIKRRVIEHFAKDAPLDNDGIPAVFDWPKYATGKSITSDDLSFCRRAKEAGFSLKVHTGIRWGHIKQRDMRDVYDQLKYAFMAGVGEQMAKEEEENVATA